MYLRPSNRTESIAKSALTGDAHYLIVCNGVAGDAPCGQYILISPATKSDCPHCGRVYPAGFLSHLGARTIEK